MQTQVLLVSIGSYISGLLKVILPESLTDIRSFSIENKEKKKFFKIKIRNQTIEDILFVIAIYAPIHCLQNNTNMFGHPDLNA